MAQAPGVDGAPSTEQSAPSNQDFSKLVERGRSFSGRERHCCFLNTGGSTLANGRFANISAASGLDFIDDGRGVALVDWDHDGDLDLWLTNRNAPRLRLLRNNFTANNHFLQIRLLGNGRDTNRDAIGARVEVSVRNSEDTRERKVGSQESYRVVNSLRAGEGFLSQSNSWLHFGLGNANQIDKVVVHWPTAEASDRSEEFTGFHVDQRYELVQGSGEANKIATLRHNLALQKSSPQIPPPAETARILLDVRLPLPDHLMYLDLDGQQQVARPGKNKRLLINFWESHCVPCIRELTEFTENARALKKAGIEILALSVDRLEHGSNVETNGAKNILRQLQFPFNVGQADIAHVSLFQNYHDFAISQNRLLPLPSSFLLDRQGRISVIYKGPISVKQLIKDTKLVSSPKPVGQIYRHPLLPGTIVQHEITDRSTMSRIATTRSTLGKALLKMKANTKLDQWGQLAVDQFSEVVQMLPDESDAHNDYGWALAQNGKLREAKSHLEKAIEIDATKSRYYANLGYVLDNLGDFHNAVQSYQSALAVEDNNPQVHYLLGNLHFGQKQYNEARKYFLRAIELQQNYAAAEHKLGAIYALHGDIKTAVRHYKRACDLAPNFATAHHHLGVVLANQGKMAAAVKYLQQAVDLDPGNEQAANQLKLARELLKK